MARQVHLLALAYGPLEHLDGSAVASTAHIFPMRRATSYNLYTPQGWTPGIYAASNPLPGARIRYHLSADMDDLSLRVTDPAGALVRQLDAPMSAGVHEVVWDLQIEERDDDGNSRGVGPRVLPGVYIVELTTGSDIVQVEVSVRMDPRVQMGRRDLMVRHQSMMESYRLGHPVGVAEEALREMEGHLDAAEELLGDRAPENLDAQMEALRDTLDSLADDLDDPPGELHHEAQRHRGDDPCNLAGSWRSPPLRPIGSNCRLPDDVQPAGGDDL